MENEIKVNQKIRNFLSSILYPENDMGRETTRTGFQAKPQEIPKDRDVQKQGPSTLNTRKDYRFTIIIALVLIVAVALFILKDIERRKGIRLEYTLEEITKVKEGIQEELVEFKQEARKRAEKDTFKLIQYRSLLLASKNRIIELLSSLKKERALRLELEAEVDDIKEILLSTMKAKGDLEKTLMEHDAKNKKINIHSVAVATAPIVKGSVSMVNLEDNFIVVDLGKNKHLSAGETLAVYRDNRFIGRLLVILVGDRTSIATVVPSWRDIAIIKQGDTVRTL